MLKLNRDNCYCSILGLYANIATASGIDEVTVRSYDCTKLEISEDVYNSVRDYYQQEEKLEAYDFAMLWMCYGPKVNDKLKDYEVEVFDGFFNF